MDPQKLRLLLRQVRDIQAQADKITRDGENSAEAIESFSIYSGELRDYIMKHVDAPEVLEYMAQLPEVDYNPVSIHFWQYIIMPWWWIVAYKDMQAREAAAQDIGHVRSHYATLEHMLKDLSL